MIRVAAIASLLVTLVLALYLPSAFPAERFLDQLRSEHRAAASLWGAGDASRMLDNALRMLDSTTGVTPVAMGRSATVGQVDTAVSREMTTVGRRLVDNAYVRSIEALVVLAMFRLSAIGHAIPWLLPFLGAAVADGQLSRLRKAREFTRHDPELFALAIVGGIVMACATFTAALLPVEMPAWVWPAAPLAIAWSMAQALACYHHRA
jgi:hypothetical protein